MSGLARRRGNYDLADTMHGYAASWQHGSTDTASAEAQTPARLAVLSSALKIALAKARDPTFPEALRDEAIKHAYDHLVEQNKTFVQKLLNEPQANTHTHTKCPQKVACA